MRDMKSDDVLVHLRGPLPWLAFGAFIVLAVTRLLRPVFGAFIVGLFLYYASRPVYRRLVQRITHPDVAVTVTLILYVLPLLIIFMYGIWVAAHQLSQLLSPSLLADVNRLLGTSIQWSTLQHPSQLLWTVVTNPQRAPLNPLQGMFLGQGNPLKTLFGVAFYVGLRFFLIVTFAFYFLRDDQKISRWVASTLGEDSTVVDYLQRVDHQLWTIYFGNMMTIAATAIVAVVTFTALGFLAPSGLGVSSPVLLGLLVGVGTIVPVVGMKIVWVPYTAYLMLVAVRLPAVPIWFPVVFFVVTLVVVDMFPDIVIRSYASARETHMGLVLLAYVLGSIAFGWYGIFLGPIILVLALQFGRHIFPRFVD